MPKHFDSAIRFLQSVEPESWVKFLNLKASTVEVCDSDLSTVTSTADFVLLLELDGIVGEHIESQASYDASMGERMVLYNVLARKKQNVPFHSTVLLLRPEADGPSSGSQVGMEFRIWSSISMWCEFGRSRRSGCSIAGWASCRSLSSAI